MSEDTRLAVRSPEQLSAEQLRLYRQFISDAGPTAYQLLAENGGLRGPFNSFVAIPNVGQKIRQLARELRRDDRLPDDLYEAAILTVGGVWQAGYLINIHTVRGLAAGLEQGVIDQLTDPARESLDASDELRTIWRFCRELTVERAVSDEAFAAASALLSEEALVGLVAVIGFYGLIGGILTCFRVSPFLPAAPPV